MMSLLHYATAGSLAARPPHGNRDLDLFQPDRSRTALPMHTTALLARTFLMTEILITIDFSSP
jgi:hypothetical protein